MFFAFRPFSSPLLTLVFCFQSFMYDAVMSILMGACHALAASSSSFSLENINGTPQAIPGMTHVRGIRSVNFTGASGLVTLPDGVRHNNITMGVFNLLPPPSRDSSGTDGDAATAPVGYVLADSYKSGTNRGDLPVRTHVQDFTFADGGKVAPKFLRDEPNQNHLGYRFRATGFVLFGVTTLCLLLCALWVIVHRDHEVVRLASPKLLVGLCFGALVEASCILLVSIDEGLKFPTIELLNRICHSVPWLLMIGHSINMGILFVMVCLQLLLIQLESTLLLTMHRHFLLNRQKAETDCTKPSGVFRTLYQPDLLGGLVHNWDRDASLSCVNGNQSGCSSLEPTGCRSRNRRILCSMPYHFQNRRGRILGDFFIISRPCKSCIRFQVKSGKRCLVDLHIYCDSN